MKYIETSENKISMFRIWLSNIWADHCNETLTFEGKQHYTLQSIKERFLD